MTLATVAGADQLLRRFALALAIYREARGEPMQGKLLVGQTIENRVVDKRWPDDYISVVTQPWQFSAFNKNDPNALVFPKERDPAWIESVAAADRVMLTEQPFTTANHYHVRGLHPAWEDPAKIVADVGHHVFYCL